jgi:hypothetical protein
MFPGAEPYVSLVENVGFCGEKHKSCGTVARLFPVRFSIRKERGKGLCLWRQKKAVSLVLRWETAFRLFNFEFFLHVHFLVVHVKEFILQERQVLVRNDFDAKSIFHLPFALHGHESLIYVGSDIRMNV